MAKFVRYGNSEESLKKDLERGFSFEGYMSFSSYESALEEVQYFEDKTEDDIKQHENGSYGFSLAGLCGYIASDIEEAREIINLNEKKYSFDNYPVCAIFEGEYIAQDQDGELFRPSQIIEFHHEIKE